MISWIFLGWVSVLGAFGGDFPVPVEGSSYLITGWDPTQSDDEKLYVFTSPSECRVARKICSEPVTAQCGREMQEYDTLCPPAMNRSTGWVRLGFQIRSAARNAGIAKSIEAADLTVLQDNMVVPPDVIDLTGMDPQRAKQLYILVIDTSSSMYENNNKPIQDVFQALANSRVKTRFLPDDVQSGVVALRFSGRGEPVQIGGGEPRVLTDRNDYEATLRNGLRFVEGGYTPLYKAVQYAVGPLLRKPAIGEFMEAHGIKKPIIVVLTDGFNNQKGTDRCQTNVVPLQETLAAIEKARSNKGGIEPLVYTVGFGEAYWKDAPVLERDTVFTVTEDDLCGPHVDRLIDSDLEDMGIDNVSLHLIAKKGGGTSSVTNKVAGLAKVFQEAAVKKYSWFKVDYKLPPVMHRKSFDIELQVTNPKVAARIDIQPNAWFDAPPMSSTGGSDRGSLGLLGAVTAFVLPALSVLVILSFLGAATFNARRTLFRRAPRRRRRS